MATINENSHAKNIANLNLLNTHIQNLGDTYNPSFASLKLENLETMYAEAFEKQHQVNIIQAPYTLAVDYRISLFAPLNRLITKIKKSYQASEGVSAAQMEDFLSISRKIQGKRKPVKKSSAANHDDTHEHSTYQMSYVMRIQNLSLLISLLQNTPGYNPNEPEFQIQSLIQMKNEMETASQKVAQTYLDLTMARDKRNNLLYHKPNNLVELATKAKTYILAIIEKDTPQYKAISKINFRLF